MNNTYLTTDALAERIHYDPRTIRDRLKDSVLIEGKHYFRPFGGRKILYIWETIERDMVGDAVEVDSSPIPMAEGGCCSAATDTVEQKSKSTARARKVADIGIPLARGGFCNG